MNDRRRLPVALPVMLLLAACGPGKPVTVAPVEPGGGTPATVAPVPAPEVPPRAGEPGGALPSGGGALDTLALPCAARLAGVPDASDGSGRATLFTEALEPPPNPGEAGCLLPVAGWYAVNDPDPLARASAAWLAAGLSNGAEDAERFIASQPASALEYRPFALRPDLYEPQQNRLLSLATGGSVTATVRLLQSLYFRDARIQDRLMPQLAPLANRQPAAFFAALGQLDGGGATFLLAALKDRDLAGFKQFLKNVKGADAERAAKYLTRLGTANAPPPAAAH